MGLTEQQTYIINEHEEYVSRFGHLVLTEQVAKTININQQMRVLDLGCGTAMSSLYLAKEYGANIIAHDLWVPPIENFDKIVEFGLEKKVIPIHGDADQIPFAHRYFDVIFSIDPYHYFLSSKQYLDYLLRFLNEDGYICLAGPIKEGSVEIEGTLDHFYSIEWWEKQANHPLLSVISKKEWKLNFQGEKTVINCLIMKKKARS